MMLDDQVRDEIALIRDAIGEGRAYATECGRDMLVWGLAVAAGYLATYAFRRGWSAVHPNLVWTVCVGLPWLYSLRNIGQRLITADAALRHSPMVTALRMLWLGCGIFLTTLAIAAMASGDIRLGRFEPVVAGVLGIGVFATAWLAGLAWLRWVAVAWWAGELALYALRQRPEASLLAAALTLLLLAAPGLALVIRRRRLYRT